MAHAVGGFLLTVARQWMTSSACSAACMHNIYMRMACGAACACDIIMTCMIYHVTSRARARHVTKILSRGTWYEHVFDMREINDNVYRLYDTVSVKKACGT